VISVRDSRPVFFAILAFSLLLLVSLVSNSVYAQLVLSNSTEQKSILSHSSPPIQTKFHAVKITSPIKGQQIPIGRDLFISGTSVDTPNSNCHVSVIVNGAKPYQPALGTGQGGGEDYSKWNFVLTSKYTAIKPGPNNRITAKYTCIDNPTVVSFSSVNITGFTAFTGPPALRQQPLQQKQNMVAANGNNNTKDQETSFVIDNNTITANRKEITLPTPSAEMLSDKSANVYLGNNRSFGGPEKSQHKGDDAADGSFINHDGSHDTHSAHSKSAKDHNTDHSSPESKTHNHKKIKDRKGSTFRFDPFDFPIYG
jgi:hypothetical protein